MAFYENQTCVSLVAGADLSTKQYHFVEVGSAGTVVVAGDGLHADGVANSNPISGRVAEVAIGGIVKVKCGGVVTRGGPVASDANGQAANAAAGDIILGTALETGANGSVIAMIFNPRGAVPAT